MGKNDGSVGSITFFVIILVAVIIVCIIVVGMQIGFVMKSITKISSKAFEANVNIINSIKNSITIGTNIGDFLACLYNAIGNYEITGKELLLDFDHLYFYFIYWCMNNNYNNVLFRENNYYYKDAKNKKLYTLPCYMIDYKIEDNNYEIFGQSTQFGYSINIAKNKENIEYELLDRNSNISIDNIKNNYTYFAIMKISNNYIRLELDDTKYEKYKNKFIQFIYDSHINNFNLNEDDDFHFILSNITKNVLLYSNGKTFNITCLNNIYSYYTQFVLINKLKKEYYDDKQESFISYYSSTFNTAFSNNNYEFSYYDNYTSRKLYLHTGTYYHSERTIKDCYVSMLPIENTLE